MQATVPYSESTTTIYELLFCDRPDIFSQNNATKASDWNKISDPNASVEQLFAITKDKIVESRVQLLAYHRLRELGAAINSKELLGVVIEVGLEGGLDTLAAYKDGTIRYINHSEKMIFWDANTESSFELVENVFTAAATVVNQIGPWEKPRLEPPGKGLIRLSFLVSDGLYFGQGPFELLQKDPIAGKVIYAATQLMMYLTEQQ